MVPCLGSSGLQAHAKKVSEILVDCLKKDKTVENLEKYTAKKEDSRQSGDSGIDLEGDEEVQTQRVCRIVVMNLKDNQQWKEYQNNQLDPLLEMERGKLCQDESRNSGKSGGSSNFLDDDILRDDDFGFTGAMTDPEKNLDL